ncbi:MAG: translation elongation factor 4 [bacterium]|nr:translation elongation factor 4 [bacterium]
MQENIRNVCIIAHIDHGKSTLADRFLELTNTVPKGKLHAQHLDSMELERERGITIKLQPVRMQWKAYEINLIDTPGHVDFSYEVSRSLAACEGAILLVDAVQGPQAQTYAHLFLAQSVGLRIIPVINKIDLPAARVDEITEELMRMVGCAREDIYLISAKTGNGVEQLLDAIVSLVPQPKGNPAAPFRALIFDARYDDFQGVVAYVRVVDGSVTPHSHVHLYATSTESEVVSVGYFAPLPRKLEELSCGAVGFVATGFKDLSLCRVGDTMGASEKMAPLPGYQQVVPMVYAGIFVREGEDFTKLLRALEELATQDASLSFAQEHSPVLGRGFRCGFLGLLHLDIIQERIKREYDLEPIITTPSVAYRIVYRDGKTKTITSPLEFEQDGSIVAVEEPWVALELYAPQDTVGVLMKLIQEFRGVYKKTSSQGEYRVVVSAEMPLSSIVTDFYDRLKGSTAGYASMNYEHLGWRAGSLVRLDVLIAGDRIEALSRIVPRDEAFREGKRTVALLKELIPKHQFIIPLQAALGGTIVARETISSLRKDVTAKLYGGDVTRKMKLLKRQKEGKKEMASKGTVHIPSSAYLGILKRSSS